MQCGRWQLFKQFPDSTNACQAKGFKGSGWDPYALAEDAELTMRITARLSSSYVLTR